MKRYLKRNWFPLGIVAALCLGVLVGRMGASLGPDANTLANRALVVLLFLLVGLNLPAESVSKGLAEWRLHLYLQGWIFVLCPTAFALAALPFGASLDGRLAVGFFALGCLPTTVSSCIVFTQTTDGNVVGSTFNAALSNLAGVVLSPLLLGLFLQGSGRALAAQEAARVVLNLALTMGLPIAAGQAGRAAFRGWVVRHKSGLGVLMNCLMLLVVFLALLAAATREDFVRSLDRMVPPFAVLAALNIGLSGLAWVGGRLLGLSRESCISAVYVAPQKTLAMGAPLLATYFAASPEILGVALLPLLFYHPWQLVVGAAVRTIILRRRAGGSS